MTVVSCTLFRKCHFPSECQHLSQTRSHYKADYLHRVVLDRGCILSNLCTLSFDRGIFGIALYTFDWGLEKKSSVMIYKVNNVKTKQGCLIKKLPNLLIFFLLSALNFIFLALCIIRWAVPLSLNPLVVNIQSKLQWKWEKVYNQSEKMVITNKRRFSS